MKKIFLLMLLIMNFIVACSQEKIIYRESFEYPDGPLPVNWWSEGCPGEIKDGHLFVNADTTSYRASSIWLNKEFSGDLRIEFDVFVVSSADSANNINCFLLYSHPEGKDLQSTREERKNGNYNLYHKLNGYIFTHLANGDESKGRFRFRDNPGFNILEENYGYECKAGKTYHIKIVKTGNRFQYWTDGIKMIDKADEEFYPVHSKGLFGFRTWHTTVWWDNLVISRVD